MSVCIHIDMYTYMNTCIYKYMCTWLCLCVYLSVYVLKYGNNNLTCTDIIVFINTHLMIWGSGWYTSCDIGEVRHAILITYTDLHIIYNIYIYTLTHAHTSTHKIHFPSHTDITYLLILRCYFIINVYKSHISKNLINFMEITNQFI